MPVYVARRAIAAGCDPHHAGIGRNDLRPTERMATARPTAKNRSKLVVLVAGGAHGIGRSVAELIGESIDCDLIVADRAPADQPLAVEHSFVPLDFAGIDRVEIMAELCAHAVTQLTRRVDWLLLCSAGPTPLTDTDADSAREFAGAAALGAALHPLLRRSTRSRVALAYSDARHLAHALDLGHYLSGAEPHRRKIEVIVFSTGAPATDMVAPVLGVGLPTDRACTVRRHAPIDLRLVAEQLLYTLEELDLGGRDVVHVVAPGYVGRTGCVEIASEQKAAIDERDRRSARQRRQVRFADDAAPEPKAACLAVHTVSCVERAHELIHGRRPPTAAELIPQYSRRAWAPAKAARRPLKGQ